MLHIMYAVEENNVDEITGRSKIAFVEMAQYKDTYLRSYWPSTLVCVELYFISKRISSSSRKNWIKTINLISIKNLKR